MAREEIVEGLRRAVSKGEPLEKATASFFNAGYPQEDIEEAVRVLQMPTISQSQFQPQFQQQAISQPQFQSQFQQPQQKIPYNQPPSPIVQRISDYGNPPSRTGTTITIILFALLLVLLGILAAVILFKEELSSFFSSILGIL